MANDFPLVLINKTAPVLILREKNNTEKKMRLFLLFKLYLPVWTGSILQVTQQKYMKNR